MNNINNNYYDNNQIKCNFTHCVNAHTSSICKPFSYIYCIVRKYVSEKLYKKISSALIT